MIGERIRDEETNIRLPNSFPFVVPLLFHRSYIVRGFLFVTFKNLTVKFYITFIIDSLIERLSLDLVAILPLTITIKVNQPYSMSVDDEPTVCCSRFRYVILLLGLLCLVVLQVNNSIFIYVLSLLLEM